MRVWLEVAAAVLVISLLVWQAGLGRLGVTIHGADGVLIESVPCPTEPAPDPCPTPRPEHVVCAGHILSEQAARQYVRIHQLGDIDNACQPDQYVRLWVECMSDGEEEANE